MSEYLAIECATEVSSVALSLENKPSQSPEIIEKSHREQRSNAQMLLPMVDSLLSENGRELQKLSGICATAGPGSFTGIRIGIALVQGLALGSRLPVTLWSSLEVLAGGWLLKNKGQKVIAALDARMREVYWAAYTMHDTGLEESVAPTLSSESDFIAAFQEHSPDIGLGSAFRLAALQPLGEHTTLNPEAAPSAAALLQLQLQFPNAKMAVHDPEKLQPLYLRNEITWKKRERIRTSAP